MTMEEKPVEITAVTKVQVITGLTLDGAPTVSVKWWEHGVQYGCVITDPAPTIAGDIAQVWDIEIPRATLSFLNRHAAFIAECDAKFAAWNAESRAKASSAGVGGFQINSEDYRPYSPPDPVDAPQESMMEKAPEPDGP